MTNSVSGGPRFYQPVVQTSEGPTAAHQGSKTSKDEHGILTACRTGNLVKVKELLENNPGYTNQTFRSGITGEMISPLYVAAVQGHDEIVELFLKKNADPDFQRGDGNTALFIASLRGHNKVIKLVLENMAHPDIPNNDGYTALSIASQYGHKEAVALLLGRQADPNIPDKSGCTALFMASQYGYKEIVALLLENNADPNITSGNGITALYMAAQNGHIKIIKHLRAAGANPFLERKPSWLRPPIRPLIIAKILCDQDPTIKEIYQPIIEELEEMEQAWQATPAPIPAPTPTPTTTSGLRRRYVQKPIDES